MLFPHHPQDVPRAIDLLQAVIAVGELDYGTMDADTCSDVDALRLLADVIKAILEPFPNTGMSESYKEILKSRLEGVAVRANSLKPRVLK